MSAQSGGGVGVGVFTVAIQVHAGCEGQTSKEVTKKCIAMGVTQQEVQQFLQMNTWCDSMSSAVCACIIKKTVKVFSGGKVGRLRCLPFRCTGLS